MTTEATDQFALAVLIELRHEYVHCQRKLSLWLDISTDLNNNLGVEQTRGVKRPSEGQLLAARERVYTLRVEIAQLQRDLDMAVKECQRLDVAIPEDFSGVYLERTNVKPSK